MSNRIQVKYGSAGLFVGPTPATGQHFDGGNNGTNNVVQLHRVQSFSDNWDIPLENVNQFGQTAAIDKISNTAPTPTFDFTYYPTNGINEYRLGFPIDGVTSIASGILDTTSDEKNYFALFTPEGVDAVPDTDRDNHYVVGLGNGFISSFDISASVGGFMEANVSVEGSNYVVHSNSSGNNIPAVNLEDGAEITTWQYAVPLTTSGTASMPTVIKKGDITFEGLPGGDLLGVNLGQANLQSFNVSVPFGRDALERLGSDFVFARPIQTPIDATVSLDFSVSDLSTGTLANIFNNCDQAVYDFTIKASPCYGSDASADTDEMAIVIKGAFVESQNTSFDIGSARNGSVSFQVPVGAANDTSKGIFLSGSYTP
jgi:hypothetical protein